MSKNKGKKNLKVAETRTAVKVSMGMTDMERSTVLRGSSLSGSQTRPNQLVGVMATLGLGRRGGCSWINN